MTEYQVIHRKYRPQCFHEVVGQEPIIRTLVNALKMQRVGHAYLFCGFKGTGKTTIARIFAKSLNCKHLSDSFEPCNTCSSCKEIAASHSLDVIEIDGASHRGIEDVRQINESAIYAPTSGRYKIYLIDEVHMLTKEAFNALLKLLEEPSESVKFLFATTEPHKIPATILSRCQRFQLRRLPLAIIEQKLTHICAEMGVQVEREALRLMAQHAGGSLRDGEVFLDQMCSFYGDVITRQGVEELLGILPESKLFALDEAIDQKNYSFAIDLVQEMLSLGKNIECFIEELIQHYRAILLLKRGSACDVNKESYKQSLQYYSQEECLQILHTLFEAAQHIRFAFSPSSHLECTLLNIMRNHKVPTLHSLVDQLRDLEKKLGGEPPKPVVEEVVVNETKQMARDATVMRFAAKELGGVLKTTGGK